MLTNILRRRYYYFMSFLKDKSVKNSYDDLRKQALNIKPDDIGLILDNNEQVYGAIVDIPAENEMVTLVCIFDGTVSLYFSNGGGALGLGQKYEEIRQAGVSFLFSAGQTIPYLSQTADFDKSKNEKTSVCLLVRDGIYKAQFDMSKTENAEKHIQYLNFLIQNVLSKIRESGAL